MDEEEAGLDEPGGGLGLRRRHPDPLPDGSGPLELDPEVMELGLDGGAAAAAGHQSAAEEEGIFRVRVWNWGAAEQWGGWGSEEGGNSSTSKC